MPGELPLERLVDQAAGKSKSPYRITPKGRRMLTQQRAGLDRIEARTRTTVDSNALLQSALAEFTARVGKLRGLVDRTAVERILDNAAKAIADLEVSNGQ